MPERNPLVPTYSRVSGIFFQGWRTWRQRTTLSLCLGDMVIGWLVAVCVAVPAIAGTRFQPRQMTRNDIPAGKGQCDIRLQVDGEVEVTVRGDRVDVRTVSGKDARDDGSECNLPLPKNEIGGFRFQVMERRDEIRLVNEPGARNGFSATVHIRDNGPGEGRYHFRLSWSTKNYDLDRPAARRRLQLE